MRFKNRAHAGQELTKELRRFQDEDPVVLGLARGGVVVAAEIARKLGAPLDVLIARKLGAPNHPEFGFGAIAPGGVIYLDRHSVEALQLTADTIQAIVDRESEEIERRSSAYRGDRAPIPVVGKTAIIVDDGLATGVTAIAASRFVRSLQPRRTILAVPVCSPQGAEALQGEADDLVCLNQPDMFYAVGLWYEEFEQTTDEEVMQLLSEHKQTESGSFRMY